MKKRLAELKVSFLLVYLLLFNYYQAQVTFQKLYGDTTVEGGFGICKSNHDNGFVYTGRGKLKLILTKVNSLGDTLWTKRLTNPGNSIGRCVIQTADSGFVVAGTQDNSGNNDVLIVKLDKHGAISWSKTYDFNSQSDYGRSIVQTNDGGYFVIGNTIDAYENPFVIRLDKQGNIKWSKIYLSNYMRYPESQVIASDGSLIISGATKDSVTISSHNPLLFKIDTVSGNLIWAKMHIGNLGTVFYSVSENSNNEIIVGGGSQDYTNGLRSGVFSKFNLAGNMLSFNTYGDCQSTLGYKLIQTSSGNYAMTGFILPCGGFSLNAFLFYIDAAGNLLWNKLYGTSTGVMAGWDVVQANDGGFAIIGSESNTTKTPADDDVNIIKTNTNGHASCNTFSTAITTSTFNPVFIATSFNYTTGFAANGFTPSVMKGLDITTLCTTADITNLKNKEGVTSVYPNPFVKTINIALENITSNDVLKIELLDVIGRNIPFAVKNTEEQNLSIQPLSEPLNNGTYFICIILKDNTRITKKIIK